MYTFLVDSHCHLNYRGIHERLDEVMKNATANGINILQTISTQMSDIPAIQTISQQYKNIFYSVGVHPLHVHEAPLVTVESLIKMASNDNKITAFGETGLDHYKTSDNKILELQKESFRSHIAAAQIVEIPVIVHTRDAEDDTYSILSAMMAKRAFSGLLHCFTGSLDLAMKAIDLGLYISASGIISFKNAHEIRNVFQQIPIDRILIETDSPFLAPVPYRGQTNEPAYVIEVAKCLAEIRGVPLKDIIHHSTNNYFKVFSRVPDNY